MSYFLSFWHASPSPQKGGGSPKESFRIQLASCWVHLQGRSCLAPYPSIWLRLLEKQRHRSSSDRFPLKPTAEIKKTHILKQMEVSVLTWRWSLGPGRSADLARPPHPLHAQSRSLGHVSRGSCSPSNSPAQPGVTTPGLPLDLRVLEIAHCDSSDAIEPYLPKPC